MELKEHLEHKTISEFMGAEVIETYFNPEKEIDHWLMDFGGKGIYPGNSRYWATGTMRWSSDWNWLHAVIDKINLVVSDEIPEQIFLNWARNNRTIFDVNIHHSEIKKIYNLVYEFILWTKKLDEEAQKTIDNYRTMKDVFPDNLFDDEK